MSRWQLIQSIHYVSENSLKTLPDTHAVGVATIPFGLCGGESNELVKRWSNKLSLHQFLLHMSWRKKIEKMYVLAPPGSVCIDNGFAV